MLRHKESLTASSSISCWSRTKVNSEFWKAMMTGSVWLVILPPICKVCSDGLASLVRQAGSQAHAPSPTDSVFAGCSSRTEDRMERLAIGHLLLRQCGFQVCTTESVQEPNPSALTIFFRSLALGLQFTDDLLCQAAMMHGRALLSRSTTGAGVSPAPITIARQASSRSVVAL